ncbi:hypothetical protein V5799_024330 [Amblyomma americanum]|uniref:Uncharacterized protein n=1 Tax=Amblyomma americanum TaxID=6943 RepID=A0AAQ4ECD1_AMBAM
MAAKALRRHKWWDCSSRPCMARHSLVPGTYSLFQATGSRLCPQVCTLAYRQSRIRPTSANTSVPTLPKASDKLILNSWVWWPWYRMSMVLSVAS